MMPLVLTGDGAVGPLSATEVGFLDGVTSSVQSQINTKANDASLGLYFITANTFSASTAVNVNNCFSATYENYLLSLQCTIVAANGINLRLRVGGTDATGANYDHARVYAGTFSRSNSQTTYNFNAIGTAGDFNYTVMDVMRPQLTKPTLFDARSNYAASGSHPLIWTSTGSHSLSTSYDGFTIYPDASTITGTVRVYGYRNS